MQPLILGFAGIANHDMPATAGTALALLAYWRWMERRTNLRALLFGLAYGLSIGLKFSCLAFVPAACAALYITRLFFDVELRRDWRAALLAFPIAAAAAAFALAASYGFILEPFRTGLTSMIAMARKGGFDGYALGQWSTRGWWWYFPLAMAVKTTLASLLLLLFVPRRRERYVPWLAAAMAILAVVLPSRIDLGVRYVLPMYVPLTIAMACAAGEMLQHGRRAIRATAIVLLISHCGSSLLAHPQYFAYFNLLAGRDPSRVLVDSNLDWGQDALILKEILREKKVDAVGLALVGMHDYRLLGYPTNYPVTPDIPATGWVAIGDHYYRMEPWPWLRGRPYQRVGAGVRLYYIPHR
jgi:4-amino-4-deoxy-L-arabinose transferase-like glycosyltransferase